MALNDINVVVKFRSLSPVLDPPGFDFNFTSTGGTPVLSDVTNLLNAVGTALTSLHAPGTGSPTAWLSGTVSRAANSATATAYDITAALGGGRKGSPVAGITFAPSTVSGGFAQMPEGVCVVTTLQAAYGSDVEFGPGTRPRSRDRGRIYFGPVNSQAIDVESTTNRAITKLTCRNDLLGMVKYLSNIPPSGVGINWILGVWSRRNALIKPLVEAWVDDRPDYQRRRAGEPTTRTMETLP